MCSPLYSSSAPGAVSIAAEGGRLCIHWNGGLDGSRVEEEKGEGEEEKNGEGD